MSTNEEVEWDHTEGLIGAGRLFVIDKDEVVEFSRYWFDVRRPGAPSHSQSDVYEDVVVIAGEEVAESAIVPSIRRVAAHLKQRSLSLVGSAQKELPLTWHRLWQTPYRWRDFALAGDYRVLAVTDDSAVDFSACRVICHRSDKLWTVHHLDRQIVVAAGCDADRTRIAALLEKLAGRLEAKDLVRLGPLAGRADDDDVE